MNNYPGDLMTRMRVINNVYSALNFHQQIEAINTPINITYFELL